MFARNVRDAAITQTVICGHDPKDSTSAPRAVPDFEKALTGNIKGLRIGIPKEYRVDGMDKEIGALWDKGIAWLKDAGAEIVEVSLPHTKYALPTYYIIAPAEASSNLARYDGVRYGLRVTPESGALKDMYCKTRAAGFGKEVKRRIMIGTYVLSAGYYDAYYKKAQRVRYLIVQDFKNAFEKVDALLTPTAPTAAFAIGDHANDPIAMYLNDIFTIPTSMAGLPGLSLPAGLSSRGLPLGLQIIGKSFDEETVFRVAGIMEEAAQFKLLPQRSAA
jgi:aspartyl-tRNA(Asn)/glutamyl-tRNA(Gln) amidotransferase subunit A